MNIRFNKKFYSRKAIKRAIEDYKNLADFNILDKKQYNIVKLSNIDEEVTNEIQNEFCNYVLHCNKNI